MKLLALSPFTNATCKNIIDLVKAADADLIVLPGYAPNTPTIAQLQSVLRSSSAVFVEGPGEKGMNPGDKKRNPPFLVTKNLITSMPRQCFSHPPNAKDLDAFCSAIPSRTFDIASSTVSFVLCGEITGFNRDGTLKHGREVLIDILINPAHTPMGRWHVLDEKLKALSLHSLAVHVTNNTRKNPTAATTDVRIYKNGHLIQGRKFNDYAAWCMCET